MPTPRDGDEPSRDPHEGEPIVEDDPPTDEWWEADERDLDPEGEPPF